MHGSDDVHASAPSGGSRRPRGRRTRSPLPPGFGPLWTTVAVDLIGFGIVFPILPRYAEDLDISPSVIGVVVASFSLAQLIFSPILGRLSDRYGRKPVLIVSLCGTAVGSVITGVAGSVWLLLLGRLLDGASGASVSVAQAAVADVAPPEDRPRLFGLLGAAFGVGFVLGPAIATLAALGGPHIPFFIAALLASVNAVVALRRLPETHPRLTGAAAVTGAAGSAGPAGRSIAEDEHVSVAGLEPDANPIGGVLSSLAGPVVRLMGVSFIALVAFSGFEGTFSLLVKDRFGLSLSATGAVFTVIGLALVLVQVGLIHAASVRLGESGTLRAGLVANLAGLLLLAVDGGWVTLVPALALLVVGQGLVTPTMSSAIAGRVPADQRGRVLGFQQSAGSLARVAGPALAGLLYERPGEPAPYLVAAVLVGAAVTLVPARQAWHSVS